MMLRAICKPWMFQSTHPYGVRLHRDGDLPGDCGFQSTHPYGVRLTTGWMCPACYRFQSTHPYGVRQPD